MLKSSNPTERPSELRAACGCRFTPQSRVPEADEGVLELTSICVPHSQQRTKRLEEERPTSQEFAEQIRRASGEEPNTEDTEEEQRAELDIEEPCKRVFAGYGVAGTGYRCESHGGNWRDAEQGCPRKRVG